VAIDAKTRSLLHATRLGKRKRKEGTGARKEKVIESIRGSRHTRSNRELDAGLGREGKETEERGEGALLQIES